MKKILALVLVLVLAIGMMSVTASAASIKVKGLTSPSFLTYDLGDEVRPGFSKNITIPVSEFSYSETDATKLPAGGLTKATALTASEESAWLKIMKTMDVRFVVRAGRNVIDEISFDSMTRLGNNIAVNILVETIDPYVSTSKVEFEYEMYFIIDGKSTASQGTITVIGTFENNVEEIDDSWDYVDGLENNVVKATEYIKDIVFGLGEGVEADIKMTKDKKIYAAAYVEAGEDDEAIFDKYPAIETAYRIDQVGLSAFTGKFMRLTDEDSSAYVYGKDAEGALVLLGRGGEKLPFCSKYYVTSTKLDIEEDVDEEVPAEVPTVADNDNPHTGR